MSVMEKIKQLEREKQDLLKTAKSDALGRARQALKDLQDLGYSYTLVEGGAPATKTTKTASAASGASKSKRRKGLRDKVLKAIVSSPDGMTRKALIATLNVTDSKDKVAVSNALSTLKSVEKIVLKDGVYSTL